MLVSPTYVRPNVDENDAQLKYFAADGALVPLGAISKQLMSCGVDCDAAMLIASVKAMMLRMAVSETK